MVCLSIVNLALGVLLAYRFRVLVLIPATLVVIVIVLAAAELAQINGVWSVLLTIGAASVSMQAGYFVGTLFQHHLRFSWHAGHIPLSIARRHKTPRVNAG